MAALELAAFAVLVVFLVHALRGSWHDAAPRLRNASLVPIGIGLALLAAYYLVFIVGWIWILRSFGIRLSYRQALRAEMLSLLAKYIPGGVWTPAARVVALRRIGIDDTSLVLGSIALEAGISAVAGVLVFVASLPTVESVQTTLWPLLAFAAALVVLLHPRIFPRAATYLARFLGGGQVPALGYGTTLGLVAYYSLTWIVGGAALWFLVRSVGHPAPSAIPFLGGTSAVGAIVAVLVVFAPSGLGVRESSMYGLLLAVVPRGAALGAVVLNRLAITLVEALLLGVTALVPGDRQARPQDSRSEVVEGAHGARGGGEA